MRSLLLPLAYSLLLGTASAQAPYTSRIDKTPANTAPDGPGSWTAISADGEFVVFVSEATDLTTPPLPATNHPNVFVTEVRTGKTEVVNVDNSGNLMQVNAYKSTDWAPNLSISADGRVIAFQSLTDLASLNDTNGSPDVYLRDRLLGKTEFLAADFKGPGKIVVTHSPSISDDGNLVLFIAVRDIRYSPFPAPIERISDALVRDRAAGTTEQITNLRATPTTRLDIYGATLSGNGQKVAMSTNHQFGDRRLQLFDRATKKLQDFGPIIGPHSSGGFQSGLSINRTGSVICFDSKVNGLVSDDNDFNWDVYALIVPTLKFQLVSRSTTGVNGSTIAQNGSISPDGRYVAFLSTDPIFTNLPVAPLAQVYVSDLETGLVTLMAISDNGIPGIGPAYSNPSAITNGPGALSDGGRFLVYSSTFQNLAKPSQFGQMGIFLRDRQTQGPQLEITGLVAGQTAHLSATGAAPSGALFMSFSITGQGPIPSYWGLIDLSPPVHSIYLPVDGQGEVSAALPVPASLAGVHLFAKGVDVLGYLPTTSFHGVVQ